MENIPLTTLNFTQDFVDGTLEVAVKELKLCG
jgi:hypothetical protein